MLPAGAARRVKAMTRAKNSSVSRVLASLAEDGLRHAGRQRQPFMELAERFREAADPGEVQSLGEEPGRAVFGRR